MASKSAEALKAKWVAAMRSGEYRQAREVLRKDVRGGFAYCCLGVLCEVTGRTQWKPAKANGISCYTLGRTGRWGKPPEIVRNAVRMGEAAMSALVVLNDDANKRFSTIATWIETHDLATGEPLPKPPTKKRA